MLSDARSFFSLMRRYIEGYEATIILGSMLALVFGVVGLATPFLTQFLIDVVFIKKQATYLVPLILVSAVVLVVLSAAGLSADYLLIRAFERANLKMKVDLFEKLQQASIDFFNEQKSGEITYRLFNDTTVIEDFFAKTVISAPINLLVLVFAGIFIASWNQKLSVFVFLVLLFQVLIIAKFRKPLLNISMKQKAKEQEISGIAVEQFRNIQLIKALAAEDVATQKISNWFTDLMNINIKAFMYTKISGLVATLINNLWSFGILFIGGAFVLSGKMSLGTLMATLLMTSILYPRLASLTEIALGFQDVRASITRFLDYYTITPSVVEKDDAITLCSDEIEISIDNLFFGYNQKEIILKNLTSTIKPKIFVAIVGKSGIGKTTLLKLLVRFYDPIEGAILLNNTNIKDFTLKSLRQAVYYVPQNQFLFAGSILDNITYGLGNISMENVIDATKKAQAHDFIASLPDSYYTQVGESGLKLSAGEAQRVALARAFLFSPKIVLLDEPTSFVDVETEKALLEALIKLKEYSTVIVVAHRLRTIQVADKVIILENDTISEVAPSKEPLSQEGLLKWVAEETLIMPE